MGKLEESLDHCKQTLLNHVSKPFITHSNVPHVSIRSMATGPRKELTNS